MGRVFLYGVLLALVVACGLDVVGALDAPTTSQSDAGLADGNDIQDTAPPPPPPYVGEWFQADRNECGSFCSKKEKTNVASPDGAWCTSGENIPPSALDAGIKYTQCWPDCTAHMTPNPKSDREDCYGDDQDKDSDETDETRGCFCK